LLALEKLEEFRERFEGFENENCEERKIFLKPLKLISTKSCQN
jgi:hypothetical protein